MKARQIRNAGFTLVELLIVVAIIGVLATLGVPQYKRMVERAKSKESQVLLAGIYTAESAFFAEYGAYGSNLLGVGYESDGGQIYTVGMPAGAACAPTFVGTAARPDVAPFKNAGSGTIETANGTYYSNSSPNNNVFGRGVVRDTTNPNNFAVAAGVNCLTVTGDMVPADGGYFVATATGCLASGCTGAGGAGAIQVNAAPAGTYGTPTADTTAAKQDSWIINQRRELRRVTNGGS